MNRYLIIYSKYTVNGVNDVKQYKKYKNTNFVQCKALSVQWHMSLECEGPFMEDNCVVVVFK